MYRMPTAPTTHCEKPRRMIARMAYRFEFDPVNKILLARFEGQLTNESAEEYHNALGKNWRATDARAGIWDLTGVADFAVAADFLRNLAKRKPITPGLTDHPRFIVVPVTAGYGLMRMFQIAGESARPLLHVVRTVDEALTTLGAQSPHFEPVEGPPGQVGEAMPTLKTRADEG
jgi:hypothetical protein